MANATISSDNENQNDRSHKFDGSYTFTINNVHEKIIKFVGNGKSSMQVFNLQASMLKSPLVYRREL